MKEINCNLCNEVYKDSSNLFDDYYSNLMARQKNILMETEFFIVIPSFGPLDKSHVMIVPKVHVNNFAVISDDKADQVSLIISLLNRYHLEEIGSPLVFFESGAGTCTGHSGGCITHAHIHCVAYSEKFQPLLFDEIALSEMKKCSILDTEHGYVWFKNEKGISFYCNRPLLPSQFLRYLYLKSKGGNQKWNWRRNIDIEGIKNVISNYSRLKVWQLKGEISGSTGDSTFFTKLY